MINVGTVTVEAHYSTNYVENYLDSVENLPDDVQRHLSRIREIDVLYRSHLRDVNTYCEQWNLNQGQGTATTGATKPNTNEPSSSSTTPTTIEPSSSLKRATSRIQKSLIAAQELGDEKLQIIQQMQDLIDHKTRQLDQDFVNLGNEFFVRLDYARDDKTLDVARDGIGASLIGGTAGGSNTSTNGPGPYGITGNGTGNGPSVSGGYGIGGAGSNGGNGGLGSNSHIIHTSNGTSGNGVGSTLGGGGNGTGMYGGNNGSGSMSSERSSKRARRTRHEQTGAGSANGSNTPNSMCGVSAMEVDPIEDVLGGNSGGGGSVPVGASPSNASGLGSGPSGTVTITSVGTSGPQLTGGIKPESGSIGSNSNGGNGGTSGSTSSHTNSLSGQSGSSQTPSSTIGGNGSKGGNGGGNGGPNSTISGTSSTSGNNGNGSGGNGSGAGSSNTQLNTSTNQGTGKKGTGSGSNATSGSGAGGANAGKKKKRKTGGRGSQATREAREDTPAAEETIDPDEPTYCLCDQISFGEMILCDNDLCPIEWFHFSCVSLISKPKGRWFCPNCRGDRPNVMKPKAQFLKELERYNKEKEEKT
ncbi:uncharacterized transmembrane protein DDB_G0289901 [Anopheles maculipalpis]|uniref:uncharacterized transmembrane protein DDB_G0289901 n=1 Tax=Anopheles maculipalpis TaxID=1496333 RepID=UPI0021594F05|nr:uncharacterized transmembrane protein DDB_G0289901 [Anopheles maculipalpis]